METADESKPRKWFALRATFGRAQKVYDKICEIKEKYKLEPYLPLELEDEKKKVKKATETKNRKANTKKKEKETDDKKDNQPKMVPLLPSLLFVRCTEEKLMKVKDLGIPGLSLYYNHTIDNGCGGDSLMIIPDEQFNSFRTIVEQTKCDILTHLKLTFIKGEKVRVIDGPFKDVIGTVLKYKHQNRVIVDLEGIGTFATAYVPKVWLERCSDDAKPSDTSEVVQAEK